MSPSRAAFAACLLSALSVSWATPAFSQDAAEDADPRIGKQLNALGYDHDIDDDGDYKLTFSFENDRSQLVYVISKVETYGKHRVREIWSPAYRSDGEGFPPIVANRLLEDSQANKMGGWVKQGDMALFVVKIAADASDSELDDAVDYAVRVADEMESELTTADEF
ncbi:MAG: hypothetical protein M3Q40_03590 [Pseudomonadota bacterium]|nr:hypothetical protein [Pseudomonadota bacterium]